MQQENVLADSLEYTNTTFPQWMWLYKKCSGIAMDSLRGEVIFPLWFLHPMPGIREEKAAFQFSFPARSLLQQHLLLSKLS